MEWQTCKKGDKNAVKIVNNGHTFYKRKIQANINGLKAHFLAGHMVVVWSAGGASWAETAIRALRLTKHINVILTKPDYYYDDDDKACTEWIPLEAQFKAERP